MNHFKNILAIAFKEDENEIENLIRNAVLIRNFFEAHLLICAISLNDSLIENRFLKSLPHRYYGEINWASLRNGPFKDKVTQLIRESSADVVFLQYDPSRMAWRNSKHNHILDCQKKELIEIIPVPVILIPFHTQLQSKPFFSLVVPISGERKGSESLNIAIQLANDLKLPVDLIHATEAQTIAKEGAIFLNQWKDQIHHEYLSLIEEFIIEAIPFSGFEERQCIRAFCHNCSNVTTLIKNRMRTDRQSLLLFEWKGIFGQGHARILKEILASADYPILLIKPKTRKYSLLKVGRNFRAS